MAQGCHARAQIRVQITAMTGGIIRTGISGWTYAPWRGVFYPTGLKREEELAYASRQFRAIEINGTFYTMLRPDVFGGWADLVPADFVFAVKGPRTITHMCRLLDVEVPLANFVASGILRLGPHLGPVLWQFPANLAFDQRRVAAFLRLLPHDIASATRLARKHDDRLQAPAWLEAGTARPIRHAFEIRHDSFRCREFVGMLRAANVALVCADSVERPRLMDVTADFVYCRLHGSKERYVGGYDGNALNEWAARAREWAAGREPSDAERIDRRATRRKRDVFIFFDNDRRVRAPADAMELMRRLKS